MAWPASPGPGSYVLTLATPAFYVLAGTLFLFTLMLWVLHRQYPGRKRGLEGYFEAAGVDLAFLSFGLALVAVLAWKDPHGNRTAFALYRVVLSGYWLTFAIPVVTVGSSVDSRSRGAIPWRLPSILVAAGMFAVFFAYFFANP
jgi:hypothetical protein